MPRPSRRTLGSAVLPARAAPSPSLRRFLPVSAGDHMDPGWSLKPPERAHFCQVPTGTPRSGRTPKRVSASGPWHGRPVPVPLSQDRGLLTASSVASHSPQGSPCPARSHQGDQACVSPTTRLTPRVALKLTVSAGRERGCLPSWSRGLTFWAPGPTGVSAGLSRSCKVASAAAYPAPRCPADPHPLQGPLLAP